MMKEKLYCTLVAQILNVHSMSRLEEIVCGKTATKIMTVLTVLWAVIIVILSYQNILTFLKLN